LDQLRKDQSIYSADRIAIVWSDSRERPAGMDRDQMQQVCNHARKLQVLFDKLQVARLGKVSSKHPRIAAPGLHLAPTRVMRIRSISDFHGRRPISTISESKREALTSGLHYYCVSRHPHPRSLQPLLALSSSHGSGRQLSFHPLSGLPS
jgi:hypothetical protein